MDDVTPAPAQDQPDVVEAPTPTVEPDSFSKFNLAEVPEEHRPFVEQAYKQLQGDYTRKTQKLATEGRLLDSLQNEATRGEALQKLTEMVGGEQALLAALGYDVNEEGEDNPEFGYDEPDEQDPLDALRAEVEALKQARQQELSAAQEAQFMARAEQSVEQQFSTLAEAGHSFNDVDKQALVSLAVSMFPPLPDNTPDVQSAFEFDQRRKDAWLEAYRESKKAPHVSQVGNSAIPTPDLDSHEARVQHMLAKLEGMNR